MDGRIDKFWLFFYHYWYVEILHAINDNVSECVTKYDSNTSVELITVLFNLLRLHRSTWFLE